MLDCVLTPDLLALRVAFQRHGFDIRLVGGVVRDLLDGRTPKDIDLCTDATPEEQRAVYEAEGINHYDTGLSHGTWTVTLNHMPYEITSLRVERDHDGRWATVSFTRDWEADLGRRDLTINAMALTFDGVFVDPFNGAEDLRNRVVRFVGEPDARMQEDYLRILRWVRFHARIAGDREPDAETVAAARRNASGLRRISRERVWSEVRRIIAGPHGPEMMALMERVGIAEHIDLPIRRDMAPVALAYRGTRDPVSLMAAHLGSVGAVAEMAMLWKWSNVERDLGLAVARHAGQGLTLADAKAMVAVNGMPKKWLVEVFRVEGRVDLAEALDLWAVPNFPVTGDDLIAAGMRPGPVMGKVLAGLRKVWAASDFTAGREVLLAQVTV